MGQDAVVSYDCWFTVLPLLKQIQGDSGGSGAALVNCRCCEEKDVVTAGSDNELGGNRCLV